VRSQGLVAEVPDAGGTDHLCWVYDDDASLDEAVGRFLSGGVARGERLLCVGDGVVDRMRSDDPPLPDAAALLERGALELLTVAEAYDAAGRFSAERQFEYYEAATRRARADGYTGLRVVAELSALAADPGHRPELMRWEHVADHFMDSGSGMTAMCAYRADLGPRTLPDVTSAHPLVRTTDAGPPFRVFVDDGRVTLAGSVDTFSAGRLSTLLASSPVRRGGAVLDLALVEFIDVAAARVLARWARGLQERSLDVEFRGASPLFRRMWRVLGLDELVPGALAEAA
jgi:anti-anti-sigma regulatory factor